MLEFTVSKPNSDVPLLAITSDLARAEQAVSAYRKLEVNFMAGDELVDSCSFREADGQSPLHRALDHAATLGADYLDIIVHKKLEVLP